MKCLLLTLLCTLALSEARRHRFRREQPEPLDWGANEQYGCGSTCTRTCAHPNPRICTYNCVYGCHCKPGFFRNADNDCVPGTECPAETKCIRELLDARVGTPGAPVPMCDEEGHFEREQCHGSDGSCWCVERESGREIEGTRTGPGDNRSDCYAEDDPEAEAGGDETADQYLF